MRVSICLLAAVFTVSVVGVNDGRSDESSGEASAAALHESFSRRMTGTALIGRFTVVGAEHEQGKLHEERYEISRVEKLQDGDLWLFQARIKYAEHDLTLPVPLQVKWAGETPVITLDQVAIPGLGTFDARVVLTKNRYAGTWQHDQHGGHLFGRIERAAQIPAAADDTQPTGGSDSP